MTSPAPFRIGVWQDETPSGGINAALTRISHALEEARSSDVALLVFPECFLTGYFRAEEEVEAVAQKVT